MMFAEQHTFRLTFNAASADGNHPLHVLYIRSTMSLVQKMYLHSKLKIFPIVENLPSFSTDLLASSLLRVRCRYSPPKVRHSYYSIALTSIMDLK